MCNEANCHNMDLKKLTLLVPIDHRYMLFEIQKLLNQVSNTRTY